MTASGYSFERRFTFEGGEQTGDASSDEEHSMRQEASLQLADFLMSLNVRGKLSAKDVCTIALLAKQCGATGPVTDLSCRSDAPSGHYQRHLTAVLNLDVPLERAYTMQVPAREKDTIERTTIEIPVMPFHESLAEELQTNPGLSFELQESLENHEWTAQYHQHTIVRGATTGEQVWPLALYVDGVPFQKQDGLIAFFGYNLVSMQRHLLLVWRRSDMCSCGCLGWCSLHIIMRCLALSFEALAAGQRPRVCHDGTPFAEREAFRAAQGATPLPKGCLVYLKGDWSEFVHTFGRPSWNSNFHPCLCCSGVSRRTG